MALELSAKLGLDVTDLSRGEVALRNFENKFEGAFKRTGSLRAERALEGVTEALGAGNLGGALESIAGRLTGIGLLGGAAFAAVGAAVVKVTADVHAAREAMRALELQTRLPLSPGIGVGALKQQLQDVTKLTDDVIAKTRTTGFAAGAGAEIGTGFLAGLIGFQGLGGKLVKDAVGPLAAGHEGIEKELAIRKAIVQAEQDAFQIEKERAGVGNRQAAIDQIQADALKKLVEIDKDAAETRLKTEQQLHDRKISKSDAASRISASDDQARQEKEIVAGERDLKILEEKRKAALGLESIYEKTQFTEKELSGLSPYAPPALADARRKIRQAEDEERQGQIARSHGDTEGAFRHFFEAERIKSSIPELSEKEKMPEYAFRAALSGTENLLSSILEAINNKDQGVPVNE